MTDALEMILDMTTHDTIIGQGKMDMDACGCGLTRMMATVRALAAGL